MMYKEITTHRCGVGRNEEIKVERSDDNPGVYRVTSSNWTTHLSLHDVTAHINLDIHCTAEVLLAIVKDKLEQENRDKRKWGRSRGQAIEYIGKALYQLHWATDRKEKEKKKEEEKNLKWTYSLSRAEQKEYDCVYTVKVAKEVNSLVMLCESAGGRQENIDRRRLYETRQSALMALRNDYGGTSWKEIEDRKTHVREVRQFIEKELKRME